MIDVKIAVIPASQITAPTVITSIAKTLSIIVTTGIEPYPIVVTANNALNSTLNSNQIFVWIPKLIVLTSVQRPIK